MICQSIKEISIIFKNYENELEKISHLTCKILTSFLTLETIKEI
jgi:hypothetical protein